LEPVWSLTTEEFLEVFRQFAATRGNPLRILSDNGRQFVLAAKVLADSEFAGIQWHFIAALSPWQGGVYERLVSLVKRAFKACIGRRILTELEFRTFTKETEACLNCRPLTFVSTEGYGFLPLRPTDFLVLHAELPLAVPEASEERLAPAEALRRRWKAQRALTISGADLRQNTSPPCVIKQGGHKRRSGHRQPARLESASRFWSKSTSRPAICGRWRSSPI
jgi:hypothetical protein